MTNILGRGLDALLSGREPAREAPQPKKQDQGPNTYKGVREPQKESVFWIETDKIRPNPEQPRTQFDEEKIKSLAESIRQYGVLQPIVVTKQEIDVPTGTQVEYQLIAGERRYRAAKIVGLLHMPAVIRREESDKLKLELALIENLQREDLNAIEKARAYKRLIDEFHLKAKEVGYRIGKSRTAVVNTTRLLTLPDYIQEAVLAGRITETHARPLVMLNDRPEDQKTLFHDILAKGLSVHDVESVRRDVLGKQVRRQINPRPSKAGVERTDTVALAMQEKLAEALGTRVTVRRDKGGKGRIFIEFFSDEEFLAIAEKIKRINEENAIPAGEMPESFTV